MAFGVHLGILLFQHTLFLDLLILQFIFLDVDRCVNFWRRRFSENSEVARRKSATTNQVRRFRTFRLPRRRL
jgi:hypothetical protein